MTDDFSDERLNEITAWLQRRVTPEEASVRLVEDDRNVIEPTVLQRIIEGVFFICSGFFIVLLIRRIVSGPSISSAESLRQWLAKRDLTSHELWEYDTAGDSWENLHGECGYALVRDGRVIDFWMYTIN